MELEHKGVTQICFLLLQLVPELLKIYWDIGFDYKLEYNVIM